MLKRKSLSPRKPQYCFIVLFLISISCLPILALIGFQVFSQENGWIYTGENFVEALLNEDEEKAFEYLSQEAQLFTQENCPDGQITSCAKDYISPEWGDFENTVYFLQGDPANHENDDYSAVFTTFWENGRVSIVVDMVNEDGDWVVTSWRGFIISHDENLDASLLRGNNLMNQFPPPVQ